jgi:hypothetical protein
VIFRLPRILAWIAVCKTSRIAAILVYARRFKIEGLFGELKNRLGIFAYHSRTHSLKNLYSANAKARNFNRARIDVKVKEHGDSLADGQDSPKEALIHSIENKSALL